MSGQVSQAEAAARKARLRAVACSYCGAPAGTPCRAPSGKKIVIHHESRHDAAMARQAES